MPFITQEKTNWKLLLIVVILAVIVGGGILTWRQVWLLKIPFINTTTSISSEQNKPKQEVKDDCLSDNCLNIQELAQKEECYYEVALNCRNDQFCKGIETQGKQIDCYIGVAEVEGAIKNNDPSQCWMYLAPYVNSACWKSFGMEGWQNYKNDQYSFEIKYPTTWESPVKDWTSVWSVGKSVVDDYCVFSLDVKSNQSQSSNSEGIADLLGKGYSKTQNPREVGYASSTELRAPLGQSGIAEAVYFSYKNNDFRFTRNVGSGFKITSECINVFNQILSNFNFTK
jgi:hypothetical protein